MLWCSDVHVAVAQPSQCMRWDDVHVSWTDSACMCCSAADVVLRYPLNPTSCDVDVAATVRSGMALFMRFEQASEHPLVSTLCMLCSLSMVITPTVLPALSYMHMMCMYW